MNIIRPLASDFIKIFESPDPKNIYCYSPGITRLANGRLIATLDLGGDGVKNLKNSVKDGWDHNKHILGKAFASDDGGKTWHHLSDFPFYHARPFVAGDSLYILGHNGDLFVMRSDDDGKTWTKASRLTEGQIWHQAPSNVHYDKGNVYLVMEKKTYDDMQGWGVSIFSPILLRGKISDDLTKKENWTFASDLAFRDVVNTDDLDFFGLPFYKTPKKSHGQVAGGKDSAPAGWLEANVVQFKDKNHYWHDPKGKTFHLWMRAHTATTGYAAIAKTVENDDGSMTTMLEEVPSGKKAVFVPCPGGQLKFHILYDEITKKYWLLSNQATDSMSRAETISKERSGLPCRERNRLQLHFSNNCIDWCFAGLVAVGPSFKQSRNYASMVIDNDDLHILSRSGDESASSDHDGNFISFHTIKNFRELIY